MVRCWFVNVIMANSSIYIDWRLLENIPTGPSLSYGGSEGQRTTALIYEKI